MSAARVEVVDLSKSFSGPLLFDGVSFVLERGALAIVGPNGVGKSTLLKIVAGLLRPSGGRVRVFHDGRELSGDDRRFAVGWSGPDLAFYPELTAAENLAFFRRVAGITPSPEDVRERIREVGLEPAGGPVEHFSTGMKQRLRIAFARLLDPPVLLLDEPWSGVDAEGREAISRFVAAAAREGPVLLASTELEELPPVDRVLTLTGQGTPPSGVVA